MKLAQEAPFDSLIRIEIYFLGVGVVEDLTLVVGCLSLRLTTEFGKATTSQNHWIGKSIRCFGVLSIELIIRSGKNIENMHPGKERMKVKEN